MNLTAYSCGGSRGIDRVPILAVRCPAAWQRVQGTEPRIRKATQWPSAGQSPAGRRRELIDVQRRPMLSCTPCSGALHRVKRETGAFKPHGLGKSGAAPATVSEW